MLLLGCALLGGALFGLAVHEEEPGPIHETGTGHRLHLISTKTEPVIDGGFCGNGRLRGVRGWWVLRDVPDYWMAEHEVSQEEFEQVMGRNPSSTKGPELPVDQVTWPEAVAFCEALTKRDREAGILPKGKIYRLPILREWLTAAQPIGLNAPDEARTWHREKSEGKLNPVVAHRGSTDGVHDLYGNVAEWTAPDPGAIGPWKEERNTIAQVFESLSQQIEQQAQKRENAWAHLLAIRVELGLPADSGRIEENVSPIKALGQAHDQFLKRGLGAKHPRILGIEAEVQQLREGREIRREIAYAVAKNEYELNTDILFTMREARDRNHNVDWESVVLSDYFLAHRDVDGPSLPGFGTYLAVGGSAFDDRDALLHRAISGENEGRIPGVGFRFVMADE